MNPVQLDHRGDPRIIGMVKSVDESV